MGEISQQRGTVRRMHNFGVKLHAVNLARVISDGRKRRVVAGADHRKPVRQSVHPVAMAHPYGQRVASRCEAVKQAVRGLNR